MSDNTMTAAEAAAARSKLGVSQVQFAVEQNVTAAVVAAWEEGRIDMPRSVATKLRWELAQQERATALAASGLAECAWVGAFEKEPMPDKIGKGLLTAGEGILGSATIGAVVGFLYGQYRRVRERASTRPAS
jgi:transcriptional regulator with XRE-family HTH domain